MSSELKETEIVTEPARLAFPSLWVPSPVSKATDAAVKYQAALLLPPDYDMGALLECVKAAMVDKWGKVIKLSGRGNPFNKCDDKSDDKPLAGYDEGWSYINVKSDYAPSVVDQKLQEVIDQERVYAGCWCRFHLNAYAWDNVGGKGVSFGLNSVQLVREDTRLGGTKSSKDVFGEIEVEAFAGGDDDDILNGGGGIDDLLG